MATMKREDSSRAEGAGTGGPVGGLDGGTTGDAGRGEATLAAELLSRAGRRLLVVGLGAAPSPSAALAADAFDRPPAPTAPRDLWETAMAGREVVLLGRRVARMFARIDPALDALSTAPPFSMAAPTAPLAAGGWARSMVWLVPRRRPADAEVDLFFRYVAGRLEFRFEADLPAPTELARTALDLLASELTDG